MVSIEKIQGGIANYIDHEMLSRMVSGSFQKVMTGVAAGVLLKRAASIAAQINNNKMLLDIGIVDGNGNVDIETIRDELKNNIPVEGMAVSVPVLGNMRFYKDDVDKLYYYIIN